MDTGLLHLHNFMRWAIIILLLASIIRAWSGWKQKRVFSINDKRIWLFTLIASHITLLIGFVSGTVGEIWNVKNQITRR